jgi:PilZ domain
MARERRTNFRVQWNSSAMLYVRDGDKGSSCIVSDFSNGGAKITGVNPSAVPDHFALRLSRGLKPRKCHVLWRSADALGVEFVDQKASSEGARAPSKTRKPAHAT